MLLRKVMALLFEWDIQLKTYHKNYHRQQSLNNGSCPMPVCADSVWMLKSLLFTISVRCWLVFSPTFLSYATYVCFSIDKHHYFANTQLSQLETVLRYATLTSTYTNTQSKRLPNFGKSYFCVWYCSFVIGPNDALGVKLFPTTNSSKREQAHLLN